MDYEFLEAAILVTSVPELFFGLSSTEYNTLNITPALPESLTFWKMENLAYGGIYYDLSIGENWVQINSIQGDSTGLRLCVTLDAPEGSFEVRQHDNILTEGTDYEVVDGKVIINVPFRNGRIQIIQH